MTYATFTDADIETAQEIAEREPVPTSWREHLERAREIVRTIGDLPEVTAFDMIMRAQDVEDPLTELMALRPAGALAYEPSGRE